MKVFSSAVLVAAVAGRSAAPDEPEMPMTCKSAIISDRKGNGIFDRYRPRGKINICKFSELMQQLGTVQMRRAVYFVDESQSSLVDDAMQRIIREWRNLSGEGWEKLDCGFDPVQGPTKRLSKRFVRDPVRCMTPDTPSQCSPGSGFIDRCDWWCGIGDNANWEEDSVSVMQSSLDIILWLTDEYFARNHHVESGDEFILKSCLREPKYGLLQNRDGNDCTVSDKCGQAVRYLHREVGKLEEVVGPIDRLSKHYEQGWRFDEDA